MGIRKPSLKSTLLFVFVLSCTLFASCLCYAIFLHQVDHRIVASVASSEPASRLEYGSRMIAISQHYDISPEPCPQNQDFLLILIGFSRPNGFVRRNAIRQTYGRLMDPACGVRLLFIVGLTQQAEVQQGLLEEAAKFGDIIQCNRFEDDYRSAAVKALYLLQWGATFCRHAVYIAKIDDDNWLNVPKYVNFLDQNQDTDYVFGVMYPPGTLVRRYPNFYDQPEKWYVPREEYAPDVYPEYCSGILYAVPTRFIGRILNASKVVPRTFNDDVYVCGLLVNAANLTRGHVPDYEWAQNAADSSCKKCGKMCIHYSTMADFYRMWNDPCCQYEPLC